VTMRVAEFRGRCETFIGAMDEPAGDIGSSIAQLR
jgi:hypothetical protein